MTENLLYIDIETIKCTNEKITQGLIDRSMKNLKPSGACKTAESRAKSLAKQVDTFDAQAIIDKTSFNGSYGEIITIGYAFNDEPINALQRDAYISEADILQAFFDIIAEYADSINIPSKMITIKWIAHYKNFDFPFIYKRAVINNIDTHGLKIPHNERHGSRYAYCTLEGFEGYGCKPGGSLDELCELFGLPGKDGFDGSMVYDAWTECEYKKIQEYCKDDVYKLREIYKRENFIRD